MRIHLNNNNSKFLTDVQNAVTWIAVLYWSSLYWHMEITRLIMACHFLTSQWAETTIAGYYTLIRIRLLAEWHWLKQTIRYCRLEKINSTRFRCCVWNIISSLLLWLIPFPELSTFKRRAALGVETDQQNVIYTSRWFYITSEALLLTWISFNPSMDK